MRNHTIRTSAGSTGAAATTASAPSTSIMDSTTTTTIETSDAAEKKIKTIQPHLLSTPLVGGVDDRVLVVPNSPRSSNTAAVSTTAVISNKQLKRLYKQNNGKCITLDIHLSSESDTKESLLKQALSELSKMSSNGGNRNNSPEKIVTSDDIVSHAIQQSRLGKFPFTKFQKQCHTPPTPLDRLVMDIELLNVVQQIFSFDSRTSTKDCKKRSTTTTTTTTKSLQDASVCNSTDVYPRLVEARLIDLNNINQQENDLNNIYGTFLKMMMRHNKSSNNENDNDNDVNDNNHKDDNDNENNHYKDTRQNNIKSLLLRVIIPLSFLDKVKYTQIQMNFLNLTTTAAPSNVDNHSATSTKQQGTNNQQNSVQPALQLLFRSSVGTSKILEGYDDISIRYVEHAQQSWISRMNTLQKCVLGYPSPNHEYWTSPTALVQLHKRYGTITNFHDNTTTLPTSKATTTTSSSSDPQQQQTTLPSSSNNCSRCPPKPLKGCQKSHPDETYLEPCRLVEPELIQFDRKQGFPILTLKQINQFREEGYLLLDGIFPKKVVKGGRNAAHQLWSTARTQNDQQNSCYSIRDFAYPFKDERLNRITSEPRLWSVMSQLLGTGDIVVMQSACFAKQGRTTKLDSTSFSTTFPISYFVQRRKKNKRRKLEKDYQQSTSSYVYPIIPGNQPMHWDFGSNTLLTPSRCPSHWSSHVEEVQSILYYDDYHNVGGGTAFVPGLFHTDQNPIHNGWYSTNHDDEGKGDPRHQLYALERQVNFCKGTMLLFQLGTWHRGTPVLPNKVRHVHHLCFRRRDATWLGTSDAFGQPNVRTIVASHGNK